MKTSACRVLSFLLLGMLMPSAFAKTFVYVANGEGAEIAVLEMNPESGELKLLGKTPAGPLTMHLAVSPDRRFLYASIRKAPFALITYAISPDTGALTQLSSVPAPDNMAYLSTDRTGRFLFCASYVAGKVAVMPLGPDGLVQAEPVQVMTTGLNAHSILADPSNRFVYVPHLGHARIRSFRFNEKTGRLTPGDPPVYMTKEASGPRHFDFSPNNRFLYVSSELDGLVYVYTFDIETGLLSEIQTISAVPRDAKLQPSVPSPGFGTPGMVNREITTISLADIHITSDGKWLYTSERATNTLNAFAVDGETGRLTYINSFPTEKVPRGFNIDPRGKFVIAAGQKSDHVAVYAINPQSGVLTLLKRYEVGKDPNWIKIVDFH